MDVYGYTPYSYNQTDELGKPPFGQQVLPSPIPDSNREVPEPHTMPAPTGAPWNAQGMSWGMPSPPELVYFTAAHSLQYHDGRLSPVKNCCKRKSLDDEPVVPAKQHITEEKMAAHLNSLHISSEYTPHALATDDIMDVNMEPSTSGIEKLKGHTIVLSEELKKLPKEEPLLPAALIDRLEKPHMSLVVWKPREHILGTVKEDERIYKEQEDTQRRNGVLVPNHQVIDDVEM